MWEHTSNKEFKLCFCSKSLCSFYSVLIIQLRWLIRQVSLYSGIKTQQGASERRYQQVTICLTLSWCKPFSGLHGSDLLRTRGVRPRRVSLLCRMGRARMRESPGLLHGPVLRTRSFPGRHGNLQLWSQLDRPRLLYRWERESTLSGFNWTSTRHTIKNGKHWKLNQLLLVSTVLDIYRGPSLKHQLVSLLYQLLCNMWCSIDW